MSKTLLLADDSLTIQRVVDLTFAQEDVRVVSFGNGDMAVKWMEDEMPDIVLADVGMPQPDGYALAQHMKQSARLRDVPVLLLTGAFEPLDDDKARESECDGVLVKPFEPQHLVARVVELLGRQRSPKADRHAEPAHSPAHSHSPAPVPHPVPVAHPVPAPHPAPVEPAASFSSDVDEPEMPAPSAVSDVAPSNASSLHLIEPPAPAAAPESFDLEAFSTDLGALDLSLELVDPAQPAEPVDTLHAIEWSVPPATEVSASDEPPASETVLEPLSPLSLTADTWDLAAPPEPARDSYPEPALEPESQPEAAAAWPHAQAQPMFEPPPAHPVSTPPQPAMPAVSLASAFAALLAAEQGHPGPTNGAGAPMMTEAAIEDIVRRVLLRVTDDMVRQVVLDAAERLVKAEIDKIKDSADED